MLKALFGALTAGIVGIFVAVGVVIIAFLLVVALIATFIKPILIGLFIIAALYTVVKVARWRLTVQGREVVKQ